MLLEVKESKYVRDTTSMALINNDNNSKQEYYEKLRVLKLQKEEINDLKEDISLVKQDITEIKTILLKILGKETNG